MAKPSGDNVVYTFGVNNGAWTSQVQSYSGPVSPSNLLMTVAASWNTSNTCPASDPSCLGSSLIQKITETTTLPVPGGTNVNRAVQITYASTNYSIPTNISEWKYYSGARPLTPDRQEIVPSLVESSGSRRTARYATWTC